MITKYKNFLFEKVGENKALFMDLDHTIIRPGEGRVRPKNINDWDFIPGVLKVMKKFQDDGYKIIIVSNQGGIEWGYQSYEGTIEKFENIKREARKEGVNITKYYFCANNKKTNINRKPNPGLAFKAVKDCGIDLDNSIMIGDLGTDVEFAKNAKIGKYYDINDFLDIKINEQFENDPFGEEMVHSEEDNEFSTIYDPDGDYVVPGFVYGPYLEWLPEEPPTLEEQIIRNYDAEFGNYPVRALDRYNFIRIQAEHHNISREKVEEIISTTFPKRY